MHPLIFALKRAHQATRRVLDLELSRYDLTAAQLDILIYLNRRGGVEQRDLQAALGVTSATLTRVIDGMENRKLVARRPSTDDSRVKTVVPTDEAIAMLQTLQQTEEGALYERFFQGLSPEEIAILTRLLNQIATNMGDHSRSIYG